MIKYQNYISRVIIGLILLSLLIINMVGIIRGVINYRDNYDFELSFMQTLKTLYYAQSFIGVLLLVTAIIGYFIPRSVGWILVIVLFYYYTFSVLYIHLPRYDNRIIDYMMAIIPIIPIVILNLKTLRNNYKLKGKLTLFYNLISIVLALSIVFIRGYLFINYDYSTYEIIELIK